MNHSGAVLFDIDGTLVDSNDAHARAGVRAIAFRCGGWNDAALYGAIAIYDGPWELLARLDESPIANPKAQSSKPKSQG